MRSSRGGQQTNGSNKKIGNVGDGKTNMELFLLEQLDKSNEMGAFKDDSDSEGISPTLTKKEPLTVNT